MADSAQDEFVATVEENLETSCWGCGLRLVLPTRSPTYKCGWCGAITHEKATDREGKMWRRWRDRCFVSIIVVFMLFVICGGVWAAYPTVFSVSKCFGVIHSIITAILSIVTLSFFCLAAFQCAGAPPSIIWGSYPSVGKGDLENYTFCYYCSKPKSPRTHHCRSCGMCVLDMDHHCPFIGNCVGASNHRAFIAFLISATVSTNYAWMLTVYTLLHIWPPLNSISVGYLNVGNTDMAWNFVTEIITSLLGSAMFLSTRGFVLVYLFFSGISLSIGLCVLLWKQLCFIYEGKTYLSHLRSPSDTADEKGDCQNLVRFFGLSYYLPRFYPRFRNPRKKHEK